MTSSAVRSINYYNPLNELPNYLFNTETAMGVSINAQLETDSEYLRVIARYALMNLLKVVEKKINEIVVIIITMGLLLITLLFNACY